VRCDIRLFHAAPRVELHYTLQKRRNNAPEGIYVAFPLGPEDGRILFETLGGVAEPARDILPGAASDWQTMQSFAGVRWPATGKAREQVVISSDEIPLVQFGEINLGKFQRETKVARPHIFSWVMNNYWTTNFKASQEGEFRFSYALTSETQATRSSATRFGVAHRIPFLGRVLPGRGAARALVSKTILPLDRSNVILIAARPASDGDGLILHLREVDGEPATIDTSAWKIGGAAARVREVTVLGLPLSELSGAVHFAPCETKFLLVEARRQ
ncbi:MAG: hypothetical protein KDA33_00340, partial [Phycisphaerales bacterium]|nr:hypothetical protein [Phycisphaerales bacterium]